jgi:hypothetical protein
MEITKTVMKFRVLCQPNKWRLSIQDVINTTKCFCVYTIYVPTSVTKSVGELFYLIQHHITWNSFI